MTNVPFINSITNELSKRKLKSDVVANAILDIAVGNDRLDEVLKIKSSASEIDGKVIPIDTIALLRAKTTTPSTVWVSGYYTKGDGAFGSNIFEWDSTSVEDDNSGTIIKLTSIATGRYKLKFSGAVNFEMFGIVGGTVSESVATRNTTIANIILKTFKYFVLKPKQAYSFDNLDFSSFTGGIFDGNKCVINPTNKNPYVLGDGTKAFLTFSEGYNTMADLWSLNAANTFVFTGVKISNPNNDYSTTVYDKCIHKFRNYDSAFFDLTIEYHKVGIEMNYLWTNSYKNIRLLSNKIGLLLGQDNTGAASAGNLNDLHFDMIRGSAYSTPSAVIYKIKDATSVHFTHCTAESNLTDTIGFDIDYGRLISIEKCHFEKTTGIRYGLKALRNLIVKNNVFTLTPLSPLKLYPSGSYAINLTFEGNDINSASKTNLAEISAYNKATIKGNTKGASDQITNYSFIKNSVTNLYYDNLDFEASDRHYSTMFNFKMKKSISSFSTDSANKIEIFKLYNHLSTNDYAISIKVMQNLGAGAYISAEGTIFIDSNLSITYVQNSESKLGTTELISLAFGIISNADTSISIMASAKYSNKGYITIDAVAV